MNNNLPTWTQVLQYFDAKGYISNGLTIPFLIGADQLLTKRTSSISVDTLIEEAQALPFFVKIMYCGNIGEYVLGVFEEEDIEMLKNYQMPYKAFGSFLLDNAKHFGDSNSISEIKRDLDLRYAANLEEGKYSRIVHSDWGAYSSEEKTRILEVLDQII